MANITTILESLRPVIEQLVDMRPLLPTYAHLIVSALVPIYTGSHASLSRPSSAAKPKKTTRYGLGAEDEDEDEDEDDKNQVGNKMEGLEPTDALIFPLMAGLTLGGLYLIIKWLKDPAILNKILSFYFSQMGLFFAGALLRDGLKVLRSYIFPTTYSAGGHQLKVIQSKRLATAVTKTQTTDNPTSIERKSPLPGPFGAIVLPATVQNGLWDLRTLSYQRIRFRAKALRLFRVKMRFDLLDIIAALISLLTVTYFAFFAKPWWLTNFLGFAFCYGSLQVISPSTFTTGSLILSSLFLYDIYFVFFTPLMVTVATKLDVPIKMVFPRPAGPSEDPSEVSLAMLGLGDIVVPGMMIGLALRFDLFLYYKYKSIAKSTKGSSTKEGPGKAVYQPATGKWGERFWSYSVFSKPSASESSYLNAISFPKPYFYASVGGYVVGMVATLIAMQFSNHAQPALLYLVPGVLVSLWGTAYLRNEIDDMWSFSDMTEDAQKPQEKAQPDQAKEKIHTTTKVGLFQRIWSGDLKAQSHSRDPGDDQKLIDKKSPADDEEKPAVKTRDSALAKSDDESETCIFSISISIPRPKS